MRIGLPSSSEERDVQILLYLRENLSKVLIQVCMTAPLVLSSSIIYLPSIAEC